MNKYFSDYLPPSMVKDMRQMMRTPIYLCLYIMGVLVIGVASLDQFVTADTSLLLQVVFLTLLIPMRAAASVGADTKARSSNFMMLTPLTSRRLVWGVLSSALVQMLITLLLFAIIFVLRIAQDPQFTLKFLFWGQVMVISVVSGAVTTCFLMFTSAINKLFKLVMQGVLVLVVLMVVFLTVWLRQGGYRGGDLEILDAPWWSVFLINAGMILWLFFELSRRAYAHVAENCSFLVRVIGILPIVWLWAMWQFELLPDYLVSQVIISSSIFFAAALFDALIPSYYMPIHRAHALRWIPASLQVPGVYPAMLYFVTGAAVLLGAVLLCYCYPIPACETVVSIHQFTSLFGIEWLLPMVILRSVLSVVASVFVVLLLMEFFFSRHNPNRPVIFLIFAFSFYVIGCIAGGLFGDSFGAYIPFANIRFCADELFSADVRIFRDYCDYASYASPMNGELSMLTGFCDMMVRLSELLDKVKQAAVVQSIVYGVSVVVMLILAKIYCSDRR